MTTTADSEAAAREIADHLVGARLAACVQVSPISSTYRWKGSVNRDQEYMCIIKTRSELTERVESEIRALHTYETPEIVVVPIVGGSSDYLAWIEAETTQ